VLGALVLEGRFHVGVQLDRAQVDVLVQGKAGLEQDADLEDAGLDVGVADGAQETFTPSARTSGPVPSPGISAMLYDFMVVLSAESALADREQGESMTPPCP
jgi:hypothetical protein